MPPDVTTGLPGCSDGNAVLNTGRASSEATVSHIKRSLTSCRRCVESHQMVDKSVPPVA